MLGTAERLRQQGEHSPAIIVAQTACELVAEWAVETYLQQRGVPDLSESIEDLLPNYKLGNSRVRKLYCALSKDDQIQDESFWRDYKTHVGLRNDIVHGGKQVTAQDAEASLLVAKQLIAHVEGVINAAANQA